MRVLFKSHNLIGDALNISPALRAWIKQNWMPYCQLGDKPIIQTLPDHVAPLYAGMVRDLCEIETVFERPAGDFQFEHVFDVNKAFEVSDKDKCHIAESYAKLLGVQLEGEKLEQRVKLTYTPSIELKQFQGKFEDNEYKDLPSLEGCILISMFSASCQSRDANVKGLPPNKMLPAEKWKPIMKLLREEYPNTPFRFLGALNDMDDVNAKNMYALDIIRPGEVMFGIPLNRLALIMQKAKLLVTIDNGMSHLGASQETPTFLMYPRCLGIHYIVPFGNPNLTYVQMEPTHVNPAQLVHALKFAIQRFKAQEAK